MISNRIAEIDDRHAVVLTRGGRICLIDAQFYEECKGTIVPGHSGYFRLSFEGKTIKLHRAVYQFFNKDFDKNLDIHHVNESPGDNRINNLITMSRSDHMKLHKTGLKRPFAKSDHQGVTWDKSRKRWRVRFRIDGKHKSFGSYTDEKSAAIRANEVIKELKLPHAINVVS